MMAERIYSSIHSWHTGKNSGDDFIIAGTEPLCHLLCRQGGLSLASNEYHLVPYPCMGNMRNINHTLIHAHATEQWCLLPMKQDCSPISRCSSEAISISYR